MLASGVLLFMCDVTKQKYQTRSRQNQLCSTSAASQSVCDVVLTIYIAHIFTVGLPR